MHSSTHLSTSPFIQFSRHSSSSASEGTDHASPPAAGEGSATNFILPVQSNTPLLALPPDIIFYLLKKYLDDSATPLVLSMTCHQLKNIYQDVYPPQERELHRFLYTITDPALYAAFNAKLPNRKLHIKAPDRNTRSKGYVMA